MLDGFPGPWQLEFEFGSDNDSIYIVVAVIAAIVIYLIVRIMTHGFDHEVEPPKEPRKIDGPRQEYGKRK